VPPELGLPHIKTDGSIAAWGDPDVGGTSPAGSGYTKIYSTDSAFAALKTDGSITVWGNSNRGGADAPAGSGYTRIYSTGAGAPVPPELGSPHALIDPSALRAAKAYSVE
jgi:hypothetical protein